MIPMTAGDQEAEDRHQECKEPAAPPDVSCHRSGVHHAEQALPDVLVPAGFVAACERHSEDRDQQPAECASAEARGSTRSGVVQPTDIDA